VTPETLGSPAVWLRHNCPCPDCRDWLAEACLDAVARYGCALLRGVPVTPGMVLEVAATFGYVRETNYRKWIKRPN
jgi:hypothetical protein